MEERCRIRKSVKFTGKHVENKQYTQEEEVVDKQRLCIDSL